MISNDEFQSQNHVDSVDFELYREHMGEFNTSALHRKLVSKVEAVRILRKELEQFRTERDQFKLMAETLQLRYSAITRNNEYSSCLGMEGNKTSVASILHETRERNIKLTTEVESLKQKLNELQGDIELLRSATKEGKSERLQNELIAESSNSEAVQWKGERSNFICHLENLKKKNVQLAFDLKTLIDEKEDIISERDAYKCKAHRLNHELLNALKANESHPKLIDIDGILLENKYLHERLKNVECELDITKQSLNKYKTMLETKRKKGIIKLGSHANDESILSHKQVKTMLDSGVDLPTKTETIQDLKSLCLALLDNLNDKHIALNHQKKTNKILAAKIAELDQRIQCLAGIGDMSGTASSCNSEYSPSQFLLQGYSASSVDSSNVIETEATTTTTTNTKCSVVLKINDSETVTTEREDSNKTSRVGISDDSVDSLSTESGRSIMSSEYGGFAGAIGTFSLSEFTNAAMHAYETSPSTTTDSGGNSSRRVNVSTSNPRITSAIARERHNDLKDLPPELAAMVQQALHELDMRDFDEVVNASEGCDDRGLGGH
ncbi:coiled-coil domain-containing protein 149-B-like isoform X1 [Rhagoletis pomonella]|uniref:coiled-coil domain-containing protein 149-B-like isoform X1 n=2 Tax=Rhagoletis pomonella TaxID=28610 RepID=UPI001782C604|nr:coiled-coil domain-containing protein 149-B-like isoform X1 [Rhagoletis pomonella]XP_036341335.1 coiled-coil domain-containing protein 149-B-like isoform X1 [Rhagoletis pomonella]